MKMDGAQACYPYPAVDVEVKRRRVGRREGHVGKPWRRRRVERPLVQILVKVANRRAGTSSTEVEKGSMVTAVGHGSIDPKR